MAHRARCRQLYDKIRDRIGSGEGWTRCHTGLILNRCSMSDDPEDLFAKAKGVAATARGNWMQKGLQKASRHPAVELAGSPGEEGDAASAPWGLDALRGRLVELSARGAA